MALNTEHSRSLSKSLHNLSTAPAAPPPVPKFRQQRSSSVGATFTAAAVVPSPANESAEILSSLISSLTILSESAREQLREAKSFEEPVWEEDSHLQPEESTVTPDHHDSLYPDETVYESDGSQAAEPPIVGYGRGRAKRDRNGAREKWDTHRSGRSSQLSLNRRPPDKSTLNAPSRGGFGVPSIQRPSNLVTPPAETTKSNPLQLFRQPSLKISEDRSCSDWPLPQPKEADAKSIQSTRSRKPTFWTRDREKEQQSPDAETMPSPVFVPPSSVQPESPAGTKHYNPLNPANREDLGDHLIPSRGSSLRYNPGEPSPKHISPSSKLDIVVGPTEKKGLNLDIDLGDEEDPTVRRIQELHRAREKRQAEWLRENRKSDRLAKRSLREKNDETAPSVLTEVAEGSVGAINTEHEHESREDSPPLMSATVDANDLHGLPAHLVQDELADLTPPLSSAPFPRDHGTAVFRTGTLSDSQPPTLAATPNKHRRRLSGGIRRSASLRARPGNSVKSVSEQVNSYLSAPRLSQKVQHPRSRRTITFSEVGDPNGYVVICCVGMGLTRYVTSFYDDIARTQKLRLITPDRPGVGETTAMPESANPPIAWADDITVICQQLGIKKFSLLAHSAGAIFALAIALKMPQYVRGRIHLLAPWIPPSQMAAHNNPDVKATNLPTSHRLLSMLPTPFLKAANSRFLSATSASLEPKVARKKMDRSTAAVYESIMSDMGADFSRLPTPVSVQGRSFSLSAASYSQPMSSSTSPAPSPSHQSTFTPPGTSFQGSRNTASPLSVDSELSPMAQAQLYNETLTRRTWHLSTLKSNPANDLVVCLERKRQVGFLYTDVTRSIIIHHGRNDERVPLDNVVWLSKTLNRCELRILDTEGHGLMASAKVMAEVLIEIGKEWDEYEIASKDKEARRQHRQDEKEKARQEARKAFVRNGHY